MIFLNNLEEDAKLQGDRMHDMSESWMEYPCPCLAGVADVPSVGQRLPPKPGRGVAEGTVSASGGGGASKGPGSSGGGYKPQKECHTHPVR